MTAAEVFATAFAVTLLILAVAIHANLTQREAIRKLRSADHSDCETRERDLLNELDFATAECKRLRGLIPAYQAPAWAGARPRLDAVHDANRKIRNGLRALPTGRKGLA